MYYNFQLNKVNQQVYDTCIIKCCTSTLSLCTCSLTFHLRCGISAGLCGLQTILGQGELEHQDVGTLQVVVDYLALMEVGQTSCNL